MENTLENKARFFAQYWGQYLVIMPKISMNIPIHVHHVNLSHIQECVLHLKPLSSITNEDAKEIGKLIWLTREHIEHLKEEINDIFSEDMLSLKTPVVKLVEAHQQLISKGYALPWMGLPVEKQIEYGWINPNKIET